MASMAVVRNAGKAARFFPKNSLSTLAEEFPNTPAPSGSGPAFSGVQSTTLANGVKVVSKETGSIAAAFGVNVGAGSRFGPEAFVFKNVAFKGTTSRSDLRLTLDIESEGLEVESAVGRENLLVSATGLQSNLQSGLSIVAEAILSPKTVGWNVNEVKSEVAAAEVAAANKDAQVLLVEKIHEAAFGEFSPLGRSIFADPASVDATQVADFAKKVTAAENLTVVGAGVSHAALVAEAQKLFGNLPKGTALRKNASPFVGGVASLKAESSHVHVALAFAAPAAGSADHAAALVLKQLVGNGAFYFPYSDNGLFGVSGASVPEGAASLVDHLVAALKSPITDASVANAKLAVATQLAVEAEDVSAVLPTLAGPAVSVSGVTTTAVRALAEKMLKSTPAVATVGPATPVPSPAAISQKL